MIVQARPRTFLPVVTALALGFAAAAASTTPAAAQDETVGLPIGARPPAVQVEKLDGTPVDLGQYVGKKPVLLEFWATWCPLCEALLPRLQAAHQRYGKDVEFLVIAVAVNQSKNSIRRHLDKHPMPFEFFWDTNGNATRAFQAPSTSYIVVLDATGKVAYTGLGDGQDIDSAVKRVVPTAKAGGRADGR